MTLPMLRPVTFFVVVMSIAKSFQVFGQVYVMTQGGPSNSTLTIVNYLYVVGFTWFEMGYAAAIAYALFALLLVVTIVQFRMATREGGSAGFVRAGFCVPLGTVCPDGSGPGGLGGAPPLDALDLAQAGRADPQPGAALDSADVHARKLSGGAGQVPAGGVGREQPGGGGWRDDPWAGSQRPGGLRLRPDAFPGTSSGSSS